MKKIFFIFIIILLCNCVYAGDNHTTHSNVINETVKNINNDKTIALEDGHFNTSFSDGSNGYCIEYGEQEATKGDTFYKVDSAYAGKQVSNYIKIFFVEYTDYALSDTIRTQHYIWHFTDGFNGWRLNYTIIDNIKNSNRIIPDYYEEQINNTTIRCFEFNVLLALYEHHQNYFTYKIYYKNITTDNETIINKNQTTIDKNQTTINKNQTAIDKNQITIDKTYNNHYIKYRPHTHMIKTGFNLYNTILILIFGMITYIRRP